MDMLNNEVKVTDGKNFKSHFTDVTTFSKITAAIVFVTLPFVGFYVGTRYSLETPVVPAVVTPSETKVVEKVAEYKKTLMGGEIPLSWSTYNTSDVSFIDSWPPEGAWQKHAYFSIASGDITFYDWNADQIDFYVLTSNARKEYIDFVATTAADDSEVVVEQKTINGANAHVVTWPLDNGQVTKVGAGGKHILFSTGTSTDSVSILIDKQALGDKAFEDTFAHFIDSVDVNKWNDPS